MVSSIDEIFAMLNFMGGNYTVSDIHYAIFLGIYSLFNI